MEVVKALAAVEEAAEEGKVGRRKTPVQMLGVVFSESCAP